VDCSRCRAENRPAAAFCGSCGHALEHICAACTAIAQRIPGEAFHELISGCFDILQRNVERHGGTVNQYLGDGIMALFGAPLAHEAHASRALRAALAIKSELLVYERQVQNSWGVPCKMRIGVNPLAPHRTPEPDIPVAPRP
jgi:hypothetical protein